MNGSGQFAISFIGSLEAEASYRLEQQQVVKECLHITFRQQFFHLW